VQHYKRRFKSERKAVPYEAMYAWMKDRDFKVAFMEVDADHGGMIPMVLPSIFNFFGRCRQTTR
jgi:uncharacterized protein YecT (DUF1311 family)